jgi:DNA-binding LytR/AlgR family response regulator
VARAASGRCHTVFTTAYDSHAIEAFEAGAVDYLLKPIAGRPPGPGRGAAAASGWPRTRPRRRWTRWWRSWRRGCSRAAWAGQRLRWISASVGDTIKMFSIDDVLFFQSDEKYTRVVTATDEAHVRKPLKEIAEGLDPEEFWQVHRGVIVRASAMARAQRDELGRITLHLKQHRETLPVSQAYAWRFKPM